MRSILTLLLLCFSLAAHAAVPVVPDVTTAPTSSTASVQPTSSTTATHLLRDIRIRPLADALRVILVFDRPTPYVVRRDDQQPRLWLDLINTRVEFLAPELSRIGDERLAGIWLRRQTDAMATLEFRLYSSKMKIEDFSLSDPPVIIIDLAREDLPEYNVSSSDRETTHTPAVATGAGTVVSARWLDLPETATIRITAAPDIVTTATTAAADPIDSPTSETLTISAAEVKEELHPIHADYEYFPVHAIQVGSQLGQETYTMFLDRRWGSAVQGESGVLNKGLSYLEQNPMSRETVSILYLIAEARFQLGVTAKPHPFNTMINFYEQAIRASDGGELAAFGHWRLGLLYHEINNDQVAIEHLRDAMKSTEPVIRRRASLLAARTMISEHHCDDALALLDSFDERLIDEPTRLQIELCRGMALAGAGRHEDAWKAFEEATKLDPQWTHHEADPLEALVEASLKTGRLDETREYIEFMNDVFGNDRDDRRVRLLLLYAEVLAAKGDEQTAVDTYNQILVKLDQTPKGAAIQRRLHEMHPESVVSGETHYCLLLWKRGEIQRAMAELDRAWKQCMREGIDTRGLEDAARAILPAFMELAVQTNHPYDAMEAWRLYGHCVKQPEERRRCFRPLVDALEQQGLYQEALRTIKLVEDGREDRADAQSMRFAVQSARLNYRLGDYTMTISRLEEILGNTLDDDLRREAYEYLARSYAASSRSLDAAQAWQLLASTPGVEPSLLATALTESGRLFLQAGMPMQTIELALKGLVREKRSLEAGLDPWPAKTSVELRQMLGEAYSAGGDVNRAMITAQDILTFKELSPEVLAQARLLLASCRHRLNRTREALDVYESIAKDTNTPEPWRRYAQVMVKMIRWDLTHPNWKVGWLPSGVAMQ